MKKIIGLMMMTDGGKSLLLDMFDNNFKNQFFMNSNRSVINIGDDLRDGKLTDFSFNGLYHILETYGCDAFALPQIQKNLTKENLIKIYNIMTDKPYIFVYIRAEDFLRYCDYGIFIGRDPRACWVVTQHRGDKEGVKSYASAYFPHFNKFLPYSERENILVIKFETLIANQEKTLRDVMELTGLSMDKDFRHSTEQYNDYFTVRDLLNMRKYSDNTRIVRDSELDYLSEAGKAFNSFFNNPEYLHLSDMVTPNIYQDIENYVQSIGWTPDKG